MYNTIYVNYGDMDKGQLMCNKFKVEKDKKCVCMHVCMHVCTELKVRTVIKMLIG